MAGRRAANSREVQVFVRKKNFLDKYGTRLILASINECYGSST
jgi:hypothetical protein